MTDFEVWMEIAEHMRRSRQIPDTQYAGPNEGLCGCLFDLGLLEVISAEQRRRLRDQLFKAYPAAYRGFAWGPNVVPPRIRACEQLAKECLEREIGEQP